MRLAFAAVFLAALVCAATAEEAKPVEVPKETLITAESKKSSRSSEQAPKVYYAKPVAQARDGAHHHHHDHGHDHGAQGYAQPAPISYDQPAAYPQPAPQAYDQPAAYPQPAPQAYDQPAPQPYAQPAPQPYAQPAPQQYDQPAQAYSVPAPAYDPNPAPVYPAPAATGYEAAAPAPAYSTPGHQGYYYYYYPVKDHKIKLKMPKFKMPKLPSLPSLHLPEYYGKDGGVSRVGTYGVAALTAALVGVGAFLSLPIIGLGAGKRSFSSIWESEYLNRDNLDVLANYVLNMIDSYVPPKQQ